MDRGRPLKPLEVSGSTREELESLSRSLSLAAGLVSRAKIVLLCADGSFAGRDNDRNFRHLLETQGLGMGLFEEINVHLPNSRASVDGTLRAPKASLTACRRRTAGRRKRLRRSTR